MADGEPNPDPDTTGGVSTPEGSFIVTPEGERVASTTQELGAEDFGPVEQEKQQQDEPQTTGPVSTPEGAKTVTPSGEEVASTTRAAQARGQVGELRQELAASRGELTASERATVQAERQQVESRISQRRLERQLETVRGTPAGTEFTVPVEGPVEETRLTRQEAINRLERGIERTEESEQEAVEVERQLEETVELQQQDTVSLAVELGREGIVGQLAESVEAFAEETAKTIAPEQFDTVIEENIEDIGGLGVGTGQAQPRESFQESIPELTEAQRRATQFTADVERATPDVAEDIASQAVTETVLQPIPDVAETPIRALGGEQFVEEEIVRRTPGFVAREVPERSIETATLTSIAAETVQAPEEVAEDIATGGVETVGRVVEDPVEFGVGEIAVDVGLDLARGGGVAIATPQAQAQAQAAQQRLQDSPLARTRTGSLAGGRAVPDTRPDAAPGISPEPSVPATVSEPVAEPEPTAQAAPDISLEAAAVTSPIVSPINRAESFSLSQAQVEAVPQEVAQPQSQAQAVPIAQEIAVPQSLAVTEALTQPVAEPVPQPVAQPQPTPVPTLTLEDDEPVEELTREEDEARGVGVRFRPSLGGLFTGTEETLTAGELDEQLQTGFGVRGLPGEEE